MAVRRASLVFQRDDSILVTAGAGREDLLDLLRRVAVLRQAVGDSLVFELSPLAMWGAAASGFASAEIVRLLDVHAATGVPAPVVARLTETMGRYGALTLESTDDGALLRATDPAILDRLPLPGERIGTNCVRLTDADIGAALISAANAGWPVVDLHLPPQTHAPASAPALRLRLRPYQEEALVAFERVGNGLILLPCGAGKTLIGAAAIARSATPALVLVPSHSIAAQWEETLRTATTLSTGDIRDRRSGTGSSGVTIATYHAATTGRASSHLLATRWSIIVFDEVQMLPADVFRRAASIRADQRLGLTATLVREDGRECEIAGLVGPPIFSLSWKELERQGWIAPARCVEVRLPFAESPAERQRFKLAALNRLLHLHHAEQIVVAGTSVAALQAAGRRLGFPVLTGGSSDIERTQRYEELRTGAIPVLGVSRIGTVGIDVPDASVLIQLSGTFGSRQEEAQRLGRLLRARPGKIAHLYSLVLEGTREVEFASRRRRFLVDQGYEYEILRAADLPRVAESSNGST